MSGNFRSGRHPKPIALKILEGSRADRLNVNEPVPPVGEVVPPALSTGAAGIWERLAPVAIGMGTLTPADVTAFAILCELQGTLEFASSQKDPRVAGRRRMRLEAAIRLERQTAGALKPYLAMFGLEPSTRSRLKVPQPAATGLRAFLEQGRRGA